MNAASPEYLFLSIKKFCHTLNTKLYTCSFGGVLNPTHHFTPLIKSALHLAYLHYK